MRGDGAPAGAVASLDRFNRLGQRADLVELDQQGIGGFLADGPAHALRVGDQQVIADNLQAVAQQFDHQLPAFPVILSQAVFDGDDRVLVDPVLPEFDHLLAGQLFAFLAQHVHLAVFVVELGGRRVERDSNLLARLVAGLLDGFQDHFHGLGVGLQCGGVTALIADQGRVAAALEHALQRVIDFRAPAQAFREGFGAKGHHHEFLRVGRLPGGVRAAVEDVHHGYGQGVGIHATNIAVERQAQGIRRGFGNRQAGAENGICAQFGFIRGAVQLEHHHINRHLLGGVPTDQRISDVVVDIVHCLRNALAQVAALVAVAHFERFVHARRCPRGDGGAAPAAVSQHNLDFYRRVAAGVKNFLPND